MRDACPRCLYPLRSRIQVTGSSYELLHYDDYEQSATHGEQVSRCPVCSLVLGQDTSEDEVAPRTRPFT